MLEVICVTTAISESVKEKIMGLVDVEPDITVIQILGSGKNMQDEDMLELALEKMVAGRNVLLCSFEASDKLHTIGLAWPNSIMFRKLEARKEFIGKLDLLNIKQEFVPLLTAFPAKACNPAVAAAVEVDLHKQKIANLIHSMGSLIRAYSTWGVAKHMNAEHLNIAREFGFTGTDEEILEAIINFRTTSSELNAGKFFPGVFVDVEGTLLRDNVLHQPTVEFVQQKANGRLVTIWTGGDVEKYQKTLKGMGLTWPVVSKLAFAGAVVECAVEDLPMEVFVKQYNIHVREFIPAP